MNRIPTAEKTFANRAKNTVTSGYRQSRNAVQQAYTKFRATHIAIQIITVVIIIIILIILFIWLYNLWTNAKYYSKESPYIITRPINAFRRNGRPVKRQSIPNPMDGLNFSYSFWIYIADWNYKFGEWKNILLKGDSTTRSPGIWLYPKTNSLHARINTHADPNEGCDIRNIPLQKWVNIVYVLDNRTVTIYIDGKLERSCVLRGVPILNNKRLQVATDGGFFGQIAKMQYFTKALTSSEVAEIYSNGPYLPSQYILWSEKDKDQSNGDNGEEDDDCPINS